MQLFATYAFAPPQSLRLRRDRAERILNGLRAAVVFLLTAAALMYAPHLSAALNIANVVVLVPTLLWTVAQYLIWYKRPELPGWLSAVNPVVDVTAVTAIIGGYAVAQSGVLECRRHLMRLRDVHLAADRPDVILLRVIVHRRDGLRRFRCPHRQDRCTGAHRIPWACHSRYTRQ